jgi:hypothetical protein
VSADRYKAVGDEVVVMWEEGEERKLLPCYISAHKRGWQNEVVGLLIHRSLSNANTELIQFAVESRQFDYSNQVFSRVISVLDIKNASQVDVLMWEKVHVVCLELKF